MSELLTVHGVNVQCRRVSDRRFKSCLMLSPHTPPRIDVLFYSCCNTQPTYLLVTVIVNLCSQTRTMLSSDDDFMWQNVIYQEMGYVTFCLFLFIQICLRVSLCVINCENDTCTEDNSVVNYCKQRAIQVEHSLFHPTLPGTTWTFLPLLYWCQKLQRREFPLHQDK